ncbi:MAG: ABC transporter permease [Firmicutes bacterium]|nr:ABC transporter permease [Bacillota bacterium]
MDILIYLFQNTLPVALPLLLVAFGGMFSERSGVINLALEGIMLFGAFIACLFIYFIPTNSMNVHILLLIATIMAALAGIIFSLLLSFAAINMKADQTIIGTAMNMFVPALVLLLCKMSFNSDSVVTGISFRIKEVPGLCDIPLIGDLLFTNTYATVYVGIVLITILTVVYYKTSFGLRLRACGEHPHAADSVGINVHVMRYAGVSISGFLGGVGGFYYVVGIMNANCNGHTGVAGFGFLALAVMIFGQWKPGKIVLAALFFAFMRTLAYSVPLIPFLYNLNINSAYYKMLPYVVTMIVLAFTSKHSKAPKAEGIPYDKGQR